MAFMKPIKILILILAFCQIMKGQEYKKTEVPSANFTTSFYDSSENCLYAGGNILVKFSGTSFSFLPNPFIDFNSIIKYKNELYVAGNGVSKFDGSKWLNLKAPYTDRINDLFIYNNELYFFTGYLQDSLFVWNGESWNKIDPGVSSINCRGITKMYYYNNELYANSSYDNGVAVIIKKANNTWSFPNGVHFNTLGDHSCIFQNRMYLSDGDRIHAYNGIKWETLGFVFHYGDYGSYYITSIRSNDEGIFVCGKIDIVYTANWEDVYDNKGSMHANNLVMLCNDENASNLDVGLEFVSDVNFLNNKIYAFGDKYYSIIDNLNKRPVPLISVKDTILCESESLEISELSNSGLKWYWQIDEFKSFSTQRVNLYNLKPGVYSPKITVSNCAGDSTVNFDSLIIMRENPTPIIESQGDTFYTSSQLSKKWYLHSNGENIFLDSTNSIVFADSIAGRYIYVVVTNEFGCTSQSAWMPTGINNSNVQDKVSIIPNPNDGIFKLELGSDLINNKKHLQIEILDINGRIIRNVEIEDTFNNIINLSYLKRGMYFIRIFNSSDSILKKIIIN
jgi:hypothetical protein